jgi:hypothetical protein
MAAKMAMTATTTSNSISVRPALPTRPQPVRRAAGNPVWLGRRQHYELNFQFLFNFETLFGFPIWVLKKTTVGQPTVVHPSNVNFARL